MYAIALAALMTASPASSAPAAAPNEAQLKTLNAKFAPVDLVLDVSKLPENERRALAKLIQAGRMMDALFLRQVWAGNETQLLSLVRDTSPLGKQRLHAFLAHKGPWNRLDHTPLLPNVPPKQPAANFYPAGAAKADVEAWLAKLPEKEKAEAKGFYTTVRRGPDGALRAVPYSVEYQGELGLAARYLREAAELTQQPTLKDYLTKRADAFLSNDYHASDVAWMNLDASIEPTIGPYEVYEDEWFNMKAAFEAFITLRDDAETQKLQRFSASLQDIENNLPIDPKLRNPKLGAMAPIRVVNVLLTAGDANRGVQTAAFNLPNDERILREKGAKRVMLKNIQQAKFQKVLVPISKIALDPADQAHVSFDAFFTHILMHELMHGLGPHAATVNGKTMTIREALQERYSPLEEAKADISGLFALQHLMDKGDIDKKMEKAMYTTFLASAFRSIRFGLNEAHGKGIAVQMNYLLDAGAFKVSPKGTFQVDVPKMKEAVKGLTNELMVLQANGDRAKADELLSKLGVLRPEVKKVLDKLAKVPVDIEPRFVTAEKLVAEAGARK
jgi:hypothetical protein